MLGSGIDAFKLFFTVFILELLLFVFQEEEKKKEDDKKRVTLERRFNLPDKRAVLVFPNPTAKSGKFDCSVMSLSVLLDYRPEDNKEHSFEVHFIISIRVLSASLFNRTVL